MPDLYRELLEAAINHLHDLEARGVRFVSVSNDAISALGTKRSVTNAETARTRESVAANRAGDTPSTRAGQAPITAVTQEHVVDAGAVLDPKAKAAAFEALRQRVMPCVKCAHLASSRRSVVFGVGNIDADIMFVGEAPGADEDAQGEPFVGAAGQLLTKIIQAMGLKRSDVYIANILKCRPDTPGQSSGNRKPTAEEMQTCIPYLHEQIDLIRPKALVALGGTAVEGLLGKTIGIMRLRGNWRAYRGIPLMPTYHPAYLLRNQSMAEKRRVWEDMLQVMEKVDLPISDKQRNFFLSPS
jgi:uracil-DNA glycosylase family 4